MTDDLRRSLAPVTDAAWQLLEAEVRRHLEALLTARRVVDFAGPLGWSACGIPTGRVDAIASPVEEAVSAKIRRCQPLVELRADFALDLDQLDEVERGRRTLDLAPALRAASALALAEDRLVFAGSAPAGIVGITSAADVARLALPSAPVDVPAAVARAASLLARRGVAGPWVLVCSHELHETLRETAGSSGRPVAHELERALGVELLRTDALSGALLLSRRGATSSSPWAGTSPSASPRSQAPASGSTSSSPSPSRSLGPRPQPCSPQRLEHLSALSAPG